jgi:hypothetical protein
MAGKAGRILSAPGWCVSSWAGISEAGKRKYVNKTIRGSCGMCKHTSARSERDRHLGVFFEQSRMSLDGTSRCGPVCRRSLAGRTRV